MMISTVGWLNVKMSRLLTRSRLVYKFIIFRHIFG